MASAASKRIEKSCRRVSCRALKKPSAVLRDSTKSPWRRFPAGRPTIVCGGPGCGKTMFAMEFLVRGATEFNEPGVLMTFEETGEEMTRNVASLGFDLRSLVRTQKNYASITCASSPAKFRKPANTIWKVCSCACSTPWIHRRQARGAGHSGSRLFRLRQRWHVARRNSPAVSLAERSQPHHCVTAERGEGTLTRYGLEEYVSDCVISLDHRVNEQISTRRMRIVKYRGSSHGTDEYPFLIDTKGFSVLPLSAHSPRSQSFRRARLQRRQGSRRMLEGKGFYKGTSVLVSGTSGSGKSTLAAHFANETCAAGKRASTSPSKNPPHQVTRNMRSVGLNLGQYIRKGLLRFAAWRPTPTRPGNASPADSRAGRRIQSRKLSSSIPSPT